MTQESIAAQSGSWRDGMHAAGRGAWVFAALLVAFAGAWSAVDARTAAAQTTTYPRIEFRAFAGIPSSTGADSTVSRKVTIRWVRDRTAELRPDFGGYHIYRTFTNRDTSNMDLLRRFSVRGLAAGDTLADGSVNTSVYARRDTLLWHFPDNQDTLQFVDPDSAGNIVKVLDCHQFDNAGRCTRGDSIFVFQSISGPHEGYAAYYTITLGVTDRTLHDTADMFVPDTLDNFARCGTASDRTTCPNLNGKATNLMTTPVYVIGPAQPNLQEVVVVPNPYRGHERWDVGTAGRVQFQNLPASVTVRIYTVAGDFVRELVKNNPLSGNLDWDLKNADQHDVASGIYVFHVTSSQGFESRGHFVVIR